MNIEEFRKAGYTAIDAICDYYANIDHLPVVSKVEPGYLAKLVPEFPPEIGEPFTDIEADFKRVILPGITHWQHPSFFAYFPSTSTFEGILGELYSSSVSNPGFNWACSPASTELEAVVMDWGVRLLGLDDRFLTKSGVGGGVIQTTASDVGLIACIAARTRYSKKHPKAKHENLVIYGTTQTHSLGAKAALILGLQFRALEVRKEDGYALKGATLEQALKEDHDAGREPFVVIGTVGTTSSGAVDDLQEIGSVLSNHPSIWFHVDAAWAGVAFALPEYREKGQLPAINRFAHSFCTNFHKWGLTNFDCSAFWVGDRKALNDALDVTPEFLRTKQGDAGTVIDYRNWQVSLGRRFRSLKLWFVFRSFGVKGFQEHFRKGIKLAEFFSSKIEQSQHFKLVAEPSLSLAVFRLVPPLDVTRSSPITPAEVNLLNRALHSRITSHLFLTQTDLGGEICLRMSTGGYRTEQKHVEMALRILEREAATVLKEFTTPLASASEPYRRLSRL